MRNKPIPTASPRPDGALFLRIASQGAAVSTHSEFVQWLQGDVQLWLPHAAMLVGCGEPRGGRLHCELFSSAALMRDLAPTSAVHRLLGYLRDCWVAGQHVPCQVELAQCEPLLCDCTAAQRQALGGIRTAIVHGTMNRATGMQTIFAALSSDANPPAGSGGALKLLLPFMDSALGRIPVPGAAAPAQAEEHGGPTTALRLLSERERQIMQWVALGKTNPEIGCILSISEFTVKNHMKSIFGKLDVANRAQAVARLTRSNAHA